MKPRIAITVGDPNGIGPEVVLKAVATPRVGRLCHPVLVGPWSVFRYYARTLDLRPPKSLVVHDTGGRFQPRPGKLSAQAGSVARSSLLSAVNLVKAGFAEAMVTAPVSKEALKKRGFRFPGQTEFLQDHTGATDTAMVLSAGRFRVGLMTIHIPVNSVSRFITKGRVQEKIRTIIAHLNVDWNIRNPKVAVLGLNPHAGENGQIGTEEKRVLVPVIRSLASAGFAVSGPFSADSFFSSYQTGSYDLVVAMYHDQGLIPLKMRAGGKGVNSTAGLPIIRTSPDHGTAFDIAGRGTAKATSMVQAIETAVRFVRNRKRSGSR